MVKNITYKNISDSLNLIFNDVEKLISNFIYEKYNIETRKTKISYTDTFIYSTLCTQNHKTKLDVINDLNSLLNLKSKLKRTTLYEKEIKIPFEFYSYIFNKITKLYNNLFVDPTIQRLIAIDGTYNNTNVFNIKGYLETSLNMGFLDINNEIPLDLTFNGIKNKNNELRTLIDYIGNNADKFKNVILVLDRAYCSYDFINFLNKYKINFVCRFRNNCKNFYLINKINRVITFTNETTEIVMNKHIDTHLINNNKFKSVKVKIINDYKLDTNLNKDLYPDNDIIDIYHKKWDIEVFFKIIKYNFNYENIRITNINQTDDAYSIHNIKILIVLMLAKLFEKAYEKINNVKLETEIIKRKYKNKKIKNNNIPYPKKIKKKTKKNKPIINYNISNNKNIKLTNDKNIIINSDINNKSKKSILKPNKSQIIKGVFRLIHIIFKAELKDNKLKENLDDYIHYVKVEINLNNKRVCKTPFKKWYIKGYTHKSDMYKIINYILGCKKKINKNLMTKS